MQAQDEACQVNRLMLTVLHRVKGRLFVIDTVADFLV